MKLQLTMSLPATQKGDVATLIQERFLPHKETGSGMPYHEQWHIFSSDVDSVNLTLVSPEEMSNDAYYLRALR